MYTIAPDKAPTLSKEVDNDVKTLAESSSSCYAQRKKPSTVMTMVISYARDLVLFSLLFVLTAYATYQNTPLKVSRAPPPTSFIQNTTLIEDFTTGKLVPTQNNVALSEISFVLYYAPWCAESKSVRQVYENVARELHGLVYFAAINCWEPRGECRVQYANVPTWPTLMAYRSNGIGIQYNGMWKEEALIRFVHSLMHPMVRLENLDDLINLSTQNRIVICAFLDLTQNFTAFRTYYQTALKFLEVDPARDLVFAVCLGRNVRNFGIDPSIPRLRIYSSDIVYEYKNASTWMQFEVATFIRQTVKVASEWATPSGIKANDIGTRFSERAALFVFTPRPYNTESSAIVDMMKQFGYSYNNCNNDTWLQRLNQNYVRQLRHGNLPTFSNLYSTSSCEDDTTSSHSTFGLYTDPDQLPINTCSSAKQDDAYMNALTSISGYACLNHKNFTIIFMDASEYSIFAERNGPKLVELDANKTRILLIDSEDEKVHELKHLSPQSISDFIRDYTEGNLQHLKKSLYSLPTPFATATPKKEDGTYHIKEITSMQFESHVMTNNKTTFVLFHSSFCAFCTTMSYYLLNAARYFNKLPFIDFYRIDVDKNDLEEKYSVINLPALVVFPANRKDDVRIFPTKMEVNTSNLISFIFSNIPKSMRLNVLMVLCNDLKQNLYSKFCASTLRKEVSSNISQALKNWSAARNCTQRSFESRKIYHLKRMYLQLLNHNIKSFKSVEKEMLTYVNL